MRRCANRLQHSHSKLSGLFPLEPGRLDQLPSEDQEAIDALLKRFEQLVATMQDQVFKGIAIAGTEDIRTMTRRDVTELMERIGAIPSAEAFRACAILRNRLAHLYPDDPDRQAANLNAAFAHADDLMTAARRLEAYVASRGWES